MVQIWKPHAGPQSGEYKGDETVPLSSLITDSILSHGPMTWSANILCCRRHQHLSHTTMYSAQHLTAMGTGRHTVVVTLEETTPACALKQTQNHHVLISAAD